jgi:Leucine-rich repeat (LRR) protein
LKVEHLNVVFSNFEYYPKEFVTKYPIVKSIGLYNSIRAAEINSGYWEVVPKNLKALKIVGDFYTDENLKKIDASFLEKLVDLEEFEMNWYPIEELDANLFRHNPKLKKIAFYLNKIKSLPENLFANLPDLKEISLSSNQIEVLPGNLFANNKNLENINFSGNNIRKIPATTFANLNKLKELDLSTNVCIDVWFSESVYNNMNEVDEKLKKCA